MTPEDQRWSDGIRKDWIYAQYVQENKPLRGHAVIQKVFFETLYLMLRLSPDERQRMGRGQIRVDQDRRVRVLKLMPLAELSARYKLATGHGQERTPIEQDREVDWDLVEVPF